MTNDWIIDVLTDLKKFSASNSMEHLAEQLDDTIIVATSALRSSGRSICQVVGDSEQTRGYAESSEPGNRA